VAIEKVFAGLDEAFANAGYSILGWDGHSDSLEYIWSKTYHPSFKWGHKSDALAFLDHSWELADFFATWNKPNEPHIQAVGMEGLAFGSPGQASSRGGIWGLYATTCMRHADTVICAPKSLKLFVTGDGKAEKEDIRDVLAKKYKIKITKKNAKTFDEWDAMGLAEVGYWAWRINTEGIDKIKSKLKPHELEVLWNLDKNTSGKPKGICNRPDDFYLKQLSGSMTMGEVEKFKESK
jgi:hypothetical protein